VKLLVMGTREIIDWESYLSLGLGSFLIMEYRKILRYFTPNFIFLHILIFCKTITILI